jgi:dolichyl-phosphate-mannose--protein O-mannosyl transferase
MLWRPWRVGAGVCFGLACGSKWNGVFVLAAFGLLMWAWDAGARRALGVSWAWARSAVVDAVPAVFSLVGVALVVYVASWTGWLVHHDVMEEAYADAYHWGAYASEEPDSAGGESVQALRDLWNYHQQMWHFHTVAVVETTSDEPHPYESHPRGWLLNSRPVGVELESDIPPGEHGCTAPQGETCLRQVIALGNPAVWWLGAGALVASLWWWVARRDWRFGVPLVAVAAAWLPWFNWNDRSIFFFYAVAFIPFTCAALAMVLGMALGPATGSGRRRRWGAVAVGVVLVAVVACFAFFWPIWTDQLITTPQWRQRMWFDRWV